MPDPIRILVVGGVAGGATAAAKARRDDEQAEIHVFERGPYVSFANCGLPYHIGGEIEDRERLLLMTPEKFWDQYRVAVHTGHEVTAIDRADKQIRVRDAAGKERDEPYDRLILSQGAQPLRPPIDGIDQEHVFTLRDIPDMDRIASFIDDHQPRTAVVIGGGFIGLEMGEAFHHRGITVHVLERLPHVLPMLDDDVAATFTEGIVRDGFAVITGAGVTGIADDHVTLEDGRTIAADLVLVAAGVRPEVGLAKEAGLAIGSTGGVRVNGRLQTDDPDIYAIGDAAETRHRITGAPLRIPLAGPANRQGRIAGANAAGGHLSYSGALGTSIVRVFDWQAATTGLSSRQADEEHLQVFTSMTRDASHAGYFPGAGTVVTKLVVDDGTGRVLGAQIVGTDGVDKRIDVLATAITAGMDVDDLAQLDLAYAPPFGSANDPINQAGFVAGHILRADVLTIDNLADAPADAVVVDVRNPEELHEHGCFDAADTVLNIPLPQLRQRLGEIPRDRPLVAACQKGKRGYNAARILAAHGFDPVLNLRGGWLQYHAQQRAAAT